ncbi:MAG TPA: Holliday junction branch migration protein RuvA [Firmicutes bacterium]|nr:MAG: hypothetical protein AA931_02250 [Peptococcaceae bacterium 1109]HHT72667.1 Holliday junction branch migration protein RuvA [Bacillota bacterium]
MIVTLSGKLAAADETSIVLEVNGVGIQVLVTQAVFRAMPSIGQMMRVFTHLHVREDALVLYGFMSEEERRLFQHMIGVSGIGPRTAVGILSAIPAADFVRAIQQEQIGVLTSLPGIGKKTAERLILELRDKLGDGPWSDTTGGDVPSMPGGALRDAVEALTVLGFSAREAELMVQGAYAQLGDDSDVQALIKLALATNIAQKGERAWRRNG